MANARILVLVHDLVGRPVKATVECRTGKQRTFRKLDYDDGLQRYVGQLEAGLCELRVQGPKGAAEERRALEITEGNNFISVMVAEPDLPALHTPQGNWYFRTRDNERLLHVTGQGARQKTSRILKENKLGFEPIAPLTATSDDDVLFRVSVDGPEGKNTQKLKQIASEVLKERGLTARVTAPGYVGDDVAFGLTDEIIVRFQSQATTAQIERLAERNGLQRLRQINWMGNAFLFRHPMGATTGLLDIVEGLNKDPLVVFAELNLAVRLQNFTYTPADYLYPETPHLQLINADDAWDTIQTSTTVNRGGSPDVVIAVLDLEGVDPTHSELTGTLSDGTTKQIANFDFVHMTNQTLANCPGEHGTQCAGSATGRFDNTVGTSGVAPNCKLIGGRLSSTPTLVEIADIWVWMAGFPTSSMTAGFPAQLSQGAHIISNSWGPSYMATNQTLRDAFDFLTTYPRDGRGVIMVFATGNYGYSLVDNRNPFSADQKTLGIGASINTDPTSPVNSAQPDHQGNTNNLPAVVDTRSYFSPYGFTIDLVSPSHTCYDPSLPGAGIVDPIMAPARTGYGDWPANAVSSTTLTSAVVVGATVLPVASTAGFSVGDYVLLDAPGAANAETTQISAIGASQLTVTAINHDHASGTSVATGPNDFAMNAAVGFGGTSHSCPTVAGAAALLLSVKPDLNWVEVRQILRTTAVRIDYGQTFATGQWVDLDLDGVNEFSQWYGYGRLDVDAAVTAAIALTARADVVVRDNLSDTGAVPSTGWHANSPDIWVRQTNDPVPTLAYGDAPPHEAPRFGQDNYVYLRVRNVGAAAAPVVFLRALITHFPGIEFQYPDDWQPTPRFGDTPTLPLEPGTYLIGETVVNNLAAGDSTIVKMTWDQDLVPPETVTVGGSTVPWHPCLLAEAAPHDGPAVVTGLAYPVKGDNNIAHRNISIEYLGGGSGMMSAIVAGTRNALGIDSLVIDRTALPADISVVLRTPDVTVMKNWTELIHSGRGVLKAEPLGVESTRLTAVPKGLSAELEERQCCDITLLTDARLAVQCCQEDLIMIDASKGTRLRRLCYSAGAERLRDRVQVDYWQGQHVIRIDHGAGVVALPLRLAVNAWLPVFIGTNVPNDTGQLRGRILVSQVRGDEEVSPGYEIEV
jgi:hypothetical protein